MTRSSMVLLVCLAAAGCSFTPPGAESGAGEPEPGDSNPVDPGTPGDPADCAVAFELTGVKTYDPSEFAPGEQELDEAIVFEIPAQLAVTAGNAGNHCAQLDFAGDEATFKCIYQGGASVSEPSQGSAQFELGLRYELVECREGESATFDECGLGGDSGPAIVAGGDHVGSRFVLAVHNGANQEFDRTEVTTAIAGTLVDCER